jgi:hypothetical protein
LENLDLSANQIYSTEAVEALKDTLLLNKKLQNLFFWMTGFTDEGK